MKSLCQEDFAMFDLQLECQAARVSGFSLVNDPAKGEIFQVGEIILDSFGRFC